MKYIFSPILFFIVFFTFANDSTNLSGLKKGSILNYELDEYGEKSTLKITIITINEETVAPKRVRLELSKLIAWYKSTKKTDHPFNHLLHFL